MMWPYASWLEKKANIATMKVEQKAKIKASAFYDLLL